MFARSNVLFAAAAVFFALHFAPPAAYAEGHGYSDEDLKNLWILKQHLQSLPGQSTEFKYRATKITVSVVETKYKLTTIKVVVVQPNKVTIIGTFVPGSLYTDEASVHGTNYKLPDREAERIADERIPDAGLCAWARLVAKKECDMPELFD